MGLLARLFGWLRRTPQQPVLDEHEAYERCHGGRVGEIRVFPAPPPTPRVLPRLAGDYLRRCFEERLESRHRRTVDPMELLRVEAVAATRDSGKQVAGSRSRDP